MFEKTCDTKQRQRIIFSNHFFMFGFLICFELLDDSITSINKVNFVPFKKRFSAISFIISLSLMKNQMLLLKLSYYSLLLEEQ